MQLFLLTPSSCPALPGAEVNRVTERQTTKLEGCTLQQGNHSWSPVASEVCVMEWHSQGSVEATIGYLQNPMPQALVVLSKFVVNGTAFLRFTIV